MVLVQLDVDREENEPLVKESSVAVLPTFILRDDQGRRVDSWIGYSGPAGWIEHLAEARADMTPIAGKLARYEQEKDAATARALVRHSEATGNREEAIAYLRDLQELDPDRKARYMADEFAMAVRGAEDEEAVSRLVALGKQVMASPSRAARDMVKVAAFSRRMLRERGLESVYADWLEQAIRGSEERADLGDAVSLRPDLVIDHALIVQEDPARAIALKKEQMAEGWREDPAALNSFAWWCFENRVNLREARELAGQAVELAEEPRLQANALDTQAELAHALGDTEQAVRLMEQAVDLQPENDYFQEQLARFREAEAGDTP